MKTIDLSAWLGPSSHLSYDPEAQALYLFLGRGHFNKKTDWTEVTNGVNIDRREDGRPIGVEILL